LNNLKELLVIYGSVFIVEKSQSKSVISYEFLTNKDLIRWLLVELNCYDEETDSIVFLNFIKVFSYFILDFYIKF
jgi:hypothetical protein